MEKKAIKKEKEKDKEKMEEEKKKMEEEVGEIWRNKAKRRW